MERLGVKISPYVLGDLFKAGTKVIPDGGPAIHLVEGGIPFGHRLTQFGIDPESKEMFFIFTPDGRRAKDIPVTWKSPVYEKEKSHGVNP